MWSIYVLEYAGGTTNVATSAVLGLVHRHRAEVAGTCQLPRWLALAVASSVFGLGGFVVAAPLIGLLVLRIKTFDVESALLAVDWGAAVALLVAAVATLVPVESPDLPRRANRVLACARELLIKFGA